MAKQWLDDQVKLDPIKNEGKNVVVECLKCTKRMKI